MEVKKIVKKGIKYRILLEVGSIDTYEEIILKYNLLYKKDISEDLFNDILKENVFYDSYYKVLNLLNKKLRSRYEIENYLKKQECPNIDKIINKLESIGLINDAKFAQAYTNDKINLSLDGPEKIRHNLEKLKVDSDIIDNVISKIDENIINEHLQKLISKKIKTSKYTGNVLKNKLKVYLVNLGYSYNDVNKALENIKGNDLSSEMLKIYNKLKLKYEGDTLKLKLKQKLYSKGFSVDEINNFIDNNL